MSHENTNWSQSVSAVCIREGKVLLARHTYGSGNGKLIIPGGYVENGEAPQEAIKREYLEETGVVIEPGELIGIRFNTHDWYVVFRAEYVSGEAHSDGEENSEVVWMEPEEALSREDVPELTKQMIRSAFKPGGWSSAPYSSLKNNPCSLYCVQ
ncbi:MAG: NUDIX hydrolase [Clostridiales bacterium]|nr:NUDIX hydrolase [Clostridiales bacterium]